MFSLLRNQKLYRVVLLLVLLLGLALRIYNFHQIDNSPLATLHQWDQSDMSFFNTWAKGIYQGDWLTNANLHPYHNWHDIIATEALSSTPSHAAAGQGTPTPDEKLQLWNRWYGNKTFHQEPLYPYLIAVTYKIFGPDVHWVYWEQIFLGLLSMCLVFTITRRLFGENAAVIAFCLMAVCGPIIHYEITLLRESLITFLTLALIEITCRTCDRDASPRWFLLGAVCGIAVLLKSTFVIFCLGLYFSLTWKWLHDKDLKGLCLRSALVTSGILLAISPALIRNVMVGASPFSLSSLGALAFVSDNVVDFSPEAGFNLSHYTPMILGKTQGQFLPSVIETLKTHPGVLSYLSLLWQKFCVIWHWYEIPDNTNYYLFCNYAPLMRYCLTFAPVAALSLVGLAVALVRRVKCWPLYLMIVSNVALLLGFHMMSRYRITLLALLIPFAAFTIDLFCQWLKAKRLPQAGAAAVAVVLLLLLLDRPLSPSVPQIRAQDYMGMYTSYYMPRIKVAWEQGELRKALALMQESLKRAQPSEVVTMTENYAHPVSSNDALLAKFYSDVYRSYGILLQNAGINSEASLQMRRADLLAQVSAKATLP